MGMYQIQGEVLMKQKTKTLVRSGKHQKTPNKKGMRSIAKSFLNVGIPVIMETQIGTQYRGMSARLIQSGNIPAAAHSNALKIKL